MNTWQSNIRSADCSPETPTALAEQGAGFFLHYVRAVLLPRPRSTVCYGDSPMLKPMHKEFHIFFSPPPYVCLLVFNDALYTSSPYPATLMQFVSEGPPAFSTLIIERLRCSGKGVRKRPVTALEVPSGKL